MKKKRNTLTDLLQEADIANYKEPEVEPKQIKSKKPKKQVESVKSTVKESPPLQTILDVIKEEPQQKVTRITTDLDEETYANLKRLVSYTGKTQAKLVRALINETVKLLRE